MWNAQFINEITVPGHRWKAFLPSASAMTEPRERAVRSPAALSPTVLSPTVLSPAVLFARKWLGARSGRSPAAAEALR